MKHTTSDTRIFKVVRQCLHPPLTLWGHTHTHAIKLQSTHTQTHGLATSHTHTRVVREHHAQGHTNHALHREHTHCSSQIKIHKNHVPSYAQSKWTEDTKSKRLIWRFPLFLMTLLLRQCCKAAWLIFQNRIEAGRMQGFDLQALGSSSCHPGGLSSLNPLLGLWRSLFYLYPSS